MRFQQELRVLQNRAHVKLKVFRFTRSHLPWFSAACLLIVFFLNHDWRLNTDLMLKYTATYFDDHDTGLKSRLPPKVNGGRAYRIPKTWNRLHSPWLKKNAPELKNPKQSRHRYLYGPSRLMSSDGIGHSMCAVNLEYNLALNMNLTYTHRVGFYSSLSRDNRMAVEEFFGWGIGEVPRRNIQKDGCTPVGGQWPDERNLYDCHMCDKPLQNGTLNIESIVEIPSILLSSNCPSFSWCRAKLERFLEKNSISNTIFQLPASICSPQKTDANFLATRNLFYTKYWNKHGRLPWRHTHDVSKNLQSQSKRGLLLSPRELNVAIHVRRGDFLKAASGRKVTKDKVFATIITRVLTIVHNVGGSLAEMKIAIHIYSEGQLKTKNAFSTHAVQLQDKKYYDHTGEPRDEDWWTSLILSTIQDDPFSSGGWEEKFKVKLHVSEDTLRSLHNMIAADVFIGSDSGLSTHLVWSLSRGVSLVPHSSSIDNEIGKKGYLCCSIPFKNEDGYFSLSTFRWYWEAYAFANEDSARHSLHGSKETHVMPNAVSL